MIKLAKIGDFLSNLVDIDQKRAFYKQSQSQKFIKIKTIHVYNRS